MMENSFERKQERILTREEVIEVISRYVENFTLVRELTDEQGLYLLEAQIDGKEKRETIQYMYMRKGRFPNHNETAETAINVVYYQDGIPVGGDNVAVFNDETGEWKEAS